MFKTNKQKKNLQKSTYAARSGHLAPPSLQGWWGCSCPFTQTVSPLLKKMLVFSHCHSLSYDLLHYGVTLLSGFAFMFLSIFLFWVLPVPFTFVVCSFLYFEGYVLVWLCAFAFHLCSLSSHYYVILSLSLIIDAPLSHLPLVLVSLFFLCTSVSYSLIMLFSVFLCFRCAPLLLLPRVCDSLFVFQFTLWTLDLDLGLTNHTY